MIEPSEQSGHLMELAHLPPGDPSRRSLVSQLSLMDRPEREYWESYLKETDEIYAAISRCEMPPGLEQQLLAVADAPPRESWWNRALSAEVGWKHVAACVLLLIGLTFAIASSVFRQPTVAQVAPLDNQLASKVCRLAVAEHQASSVPKIKGSEAGQLEAVLGAELSFQVSILHPQAEMQLIGGSIENFDNSAAVVTRWMSGGIPYTLIQFDGKQMGFPIVFPRTEKSPAIVGKGGNRYRVVIWPGIDGTSDWALVMESDSVRDLFSYTCH